MSAHGTLITLGAALLSMIVGFELDVRYGGDRPRWVLVFILTALALAIGFTYMVGV